jgi:beta-fructofuranosidase
MFYTGISSHDGGAVQRVLHANSPDLLTWEKTNDVVEADSRWYETTSPDVGDVAWRDPWVFHDEASASFHMLTTARAKTGPIDGRGVIGHAVSSDLSRWSLQPPLSEPGDFLFLEVPQLIEIGGVWRVLFSAPPGTQSATRRARNADTAAHGGTHYLVGQEKLGPYALVDELFFVGDATASLFAGRILEHNDRLLFFAFRGYDAKGRFYGELTDPIPVAVRPNGSLALDV